MNTKQKLSASSEDYLEAIYNLVCRNKVARCREIAENLNVSRASVTGALKFLASKGLVLYEPYGYIVLTEKGTKEAQSVVRRHNVIESFFINVLCVDESNAKKAACKAEHVLGPVVIPKLLKFTEFYCKKGTDFSSEFQKYCQSKGV